MATPPANVNPLRTPTQLPLFTIYSFTSMSSLPNISFVIDRSFLPSLPTSSSVPNMSSAFPLPHKLNPPAASPNPAPPTEAELFEKDDLEFRTITTLLRTLGARDRVTVDNFQVSSQQRPSLKSLTALSSLLVRDCEIIAVMPKRSVRGTTIIVGSTAENSTEKAFWDHESNSSSRSSSSIESFITRNPEYLDPVGPVALLESPIVHLDSDIFAFILQNWLVTEPARKPIPLTSYSRSREQSFDHHVQSFATMLNKALANPDDVPAREVLDLYSTFQSIPKICRRFRNSRWVNELLKLPPCFNVAHVPSPEDQGQIDAILSANKGATSHSVLYTFLDDPPADLREWLPEFHNFFLWFLRILNQQIKRLTKLRGKKDIPRGLSASQIKDAYRNLGVLQYFSWQSPFFADYISVVFAPTIRDPHDIATGVPAVRLSSELEEDVSAPQKSEEPQGGERVENMGLDIATEFETDQERALLTTPGEDTHPCILELRLISSNIQNLDRLVRRTPRTRFRFQVVQYPPAGRSLMPWRDLIQALFPKLQFRTVILQALADTPGKEFDYFRPGGDMLTFNGQAHCEAVLGCLFSLTKRGEDNTWVIPISASYIPLLTVDPLDRYSTISPRRDRHLLQSPRTLQALLSRLCDNYFLPLRGSRGGWRHGYPRPEQTLHHLAVCAPSRITKFHSPQTAR